MQGKSCTRVDIYQKLGYKNTNRFKQTDYSIIFKEVIMKLEHFHYLLEIYRLHSISAAARKLHIKQTTLSAIVKAAEEEIGFSIFQRTPGGVTTTPAGEELMSLAWEINLRVCDKKSVNKEIRQGLL